MFFLRNQTALASLGLNDNWFLPVTRTSNPAAVFRRKFNRKSAGGQKPECLLSGRLFFWFY